MIQESLHPFTDPHVPVAHPLDSRRKGSGGALSYCASLRGIKDTFTGGSEVSAVAEEILQRTDTGRLRLLDVGVGDGRYAAKLVGLLRAGGRDVILTGIDPLPEAILGARDSLPGAQLFCTTAESFSTDTTFDVVVTTHSIYYAAHVPAYVHKLLHLLARDGLLVITAWSTACAVFRLSQLAWPRTVTPLVTAEKLFAYLQTERGSSVSERLFVGGVDFGRWQQEHVQRSAQVVLSREFAQFRSAPSTNLTELLQRFCPCSLRVNRTIFVPAEG